MGPARDIPAHRLAAGDIGTVVLVHGEGKGFECKFMTLDRETAAVAIRRAGQVRAVQHDEIAHARPIAS